MRGVRHLLRFAVFGFSISLFGQPDRSGFSAPIVVDTKGVGFHFTDPVKGDYVSFDLKGDGKLVKVSWPQAGSGNMWLVLVDPAGTVTNGGQLFGNHSPHSDADVPNYPNPNGFNALNWWDKPQQGGAGHLIIGPQDKVYTGLPDGRKLMLWDAGNCLKERDSACVSKPGELHTLESEGIRSISGVWGSASKEKIPKGTPLFVKNGWQQYGALGGVEDVVGNQYVFYTLLNPDVADEPRNAHGEEVNAKGEVCCDEHQKSHDGRWAIDVYLKSIQ
jgi:hypothetical protein